MNLKGQLIKLNRKVKYTLGAYFINLLINNIPYLIREEYPPNIINISGGGDFKKIGENNVERLTRIGGLKEGMTILEIGCGIGRNAKPLAEKYGNKITYYGFDIVSFGISWCRSKIGLKYPSYTFELVDLYNSFYRPHGKELAETFSFPIEDNSIDFCFHTSVFTHMDFNSIANYIYEMSRVLKPGGKAFFTCFLKYNITISAIFSFNFERNNYFYEDECEPLLAVAYDPEIINGLIQKCFIIKKPIHYGSWRDMEHHENYEDFQDIIILEKRS